MDTVSYTHLVKLGFDVKALSEMLGHSSVEITLNRYVHSSFEQKKEYMKRLQDVYKRQGLYNQEIISY